MTQRQMIDRRGTSPRPGHDMAEIAKAILIRAMEACCGKVNCGSREDFAVSLRLGDGDSCSYFRHSLAQHVSRFLGIRDPNVKAVYLFSDSANPDDTYLDESTPSSPVHLIVWVRTRTETLDSVVEEFGRALAHRYALLVNQPRLERLLDVHIVTDADVNGHRGYGALLLSIVNPPLRVWTC